MMSSKTYPEPVASDDGLVPLALDANKLKFSGPTVEIAPLETEHVAMLWSTTMMDNQPNMRLFRQVYGEDCDNPQSFASIIEQGRSTATHIPLMVTSHGSNQPSNWLAICTPQKQGDSLLCAKFLENTLRGEAHLESSYLINCHVFEDLHHDTIRVRQGSLPKDHPIRYERSLLASFRRTLLVPEESEISDLFLVTRHNWLATKVTTAAWVGVDVAEHKERRGLSM